MDYFLASLAETYYRTHSLKHSSYLQEIQAVRDYFLSRGLDKFCYADALDILVGSAKDQMRNGYSSIEAGKISKEIYIMSVAYSIISKDELRSKCAKYVFEDIFTRASQR